MEPINGAAELVSDGSGQCSAVQGNIPATLRQAPQMDPFFNFQLVVFQVGNTLFQVLKNGFDVPGTIFEAMFALPPRPVDENEYRLEGMSPESPILLEGIAEDQFRAFLHALNPFAGGPPLVAFEDWVGVLHLATMWEFNLVRRSAIKALSDVISNRDAKEQIFLGLTYKVVDWARDGYVRIVQRPAIQHTELNNNPFPLRWKTIASIFAVRERMGLISGSQSYCGACATHNGTGYATRTCRCKSLAAVNVEFKEELRVLEEPPPSSAPGPPLPSTDTSVFVSSSEIIITGTKKNKKRCGN